MGQMLRKGCQGNKQEKNPRKHGVVQDLMHCLFKCQVLDCYPIRGTPVIPNILSEVLVQWGTFLVASKNFGGLLAYSLIRCG